MENKRLSDKELIKKYGKLPSLSIDKSVVHLVIHLLGSLFLFLYATGALCLIFFGLFKCLFLRVSHYTYTDSDLTLILQITSILTVIVIILVIPSWINTRKQERILRKDFEENCTLNEDDLVLLIRNKSFLHYFSIIQQICKLNPAASESQKNILTRWNQFDKETIEKLVFDKIYYEEDASFHASNAEFMSLDEKKTFADLLFKLAVVQDGIHNDEWQLLMQTLSDLKFNNNYIEYYKRRYGPLRTEFEDDHRDSASTEKSSVFLNKYYSILGLDENATDEDIKRAYHNLALQHHPDLPKNAGRIQECEEMMAKINEAYEKVRG